MSFLKDIINPLGSDFLRGEGSGRERGQKDALIQSLRSSNQDFGEQSLDQLVQGLQARIGGYDQAIAKTSGISRHERREAVGQAKTAEGTLLSRYGAGGKFGTTAFDNAMQGLHSSLTQDLEGIDSNFAGLFSQLATGRGEAEASGRGAIASLFQGQAGQEANIIQMLLGNVKPTQQGALSGILQALGAGFGASAGGPAGGAVGGELGGALGGSLERT